MKKLIIIPGASEEIVEQFARQLSEATRNGILVYNHPIKIYDMDHVESWSKKKLKGFLKERGIEIK